MSPKNMQSGNLIGIGFLNPIGGTIMHCFWFNSKYITTRLTTNKQIIFFFGAQRYASKTVKMSKQYKYI